jgi:hypothetical protein
MKETPHYLNLLNKEFFEKYYIKDKMSYPKIREMLLKQGFNIHNGTLQRYAKKFNIGRGSSAARRILDPQSLDYNKNYIQEKDIEFLDGFLLGDGGINPNNNSFVGRLCCGVEYEEFCEYLIKPFDHLGAKVTKTSSISMKQGFIFYGVTRFHPDIYKQYLRWYPINSEGKRVKQVPKDVVISPISVVRWFLGDGSTVQSEDNSTIIIRLSTDGFHYSGVKFLVKKLNNIGIICHRTSENRIMINSRGVPSFFNYIGRDSPIKCYNYKFALPSFRFESKRMKEVAEELKIDYDRLAYFVKIGKINSYRLSPIGRPRFLPKHIEECKKLIESGELF